MISFDKDTIRESLSLDNIFELLTEWGGEPIYTDFGLVSATICHNRPGEGSHKLYFYENSGLFRCYTGCDSSFDIFELTIKVINIQENKEYDLNDAVRYIAYKFGFSGEYKQDVGEQLKDWEVIARNDRIKEIELNNYSVVLEDYDDIILSRLNYSVKIGPWLDEGISQQALEHGNIGFFPGTDQITIPHYDINGRFIGLRGRALCKEEAQKYGKYRPIKINDTLYTHPLGMNLYNLNNSKDNIKALKKAIIFESEKSCLFYQTYFGFDEDISVACCGSSISAYQMQLLLDLGVQEVIVAFDRQFQKLGDDEFILLIRKFQKIHSKYKQFVKMSFILDKKRILSYKASPVDEGPEKFCQLVHERITF